MVEVGWVEEGVMCLRMVPQIDARCVCVWFRKLTHDDRCLDGWIDGEADGRIDGEKDAWLGA
eukprot:357339-Chlamydomonas_euryale.AAC.6